MRAIAGCLTLALVPAGLYAATQDSFQIQVVTTETATAQGIALKAGTYVALRANEIDASGNRTSDHGSDPLTWSVSGPGTLQAATASTYPGALEIFRSSTPSEVDVTVVDPLAPTVTGTLHISVYQPQLTSFQIVPSPGDLLGQGPDLATAVMALGRRYGFTASGGVDQVGAAYPIPAVTWSLSQPQVGSIDSVGTLVPTTPGSTSIVASAGGATVRLPGIIYAPVISSISAFNLAQNSTRMATRDTDPIQVTATAYDQYQALITPTPAFSWTTTPGSDGTVTQNGLFTPFLQDGTAGVIASAGGVSSPTAVITVAVPTGAFIGLDTTTAGNWYFGYGRDGDFKAGDDHPTYQPLRMPAYYIHTLRPNTFVSVQAAAPEIYLGVEQYTNVALATRQSLTTVTYVRTVAWWSSPTTVSFPIDLSDTAYHEVSFYLLDWNHAGCSERIDVLNPTTGQILFTSGTIAAFTNGVYASFWMKGRVQVRVTPLTATCPVVLSGVFYGGPLYLGNSG